MCKRPHDGYSRPDFRYGEDGRLLPEYMFVTIPHALYDEHNRVIGWHWPNRERNERIADASCKEWRLRQIELAQMGKME